ncbi:MAG: polymer-forming cytoskeletal protein [Pseudomonadota bacterium]
MFSRRVERDDAPDGRPATLADQRGERRFSEREAQAAARQAARSAEEPRQRADTTRPTEEMRRSVIQPDLMIKGEVLAQGALELHGRVDGDVLARDVLVCETAQVLGDVVGERVTIAGSVHGKVTGDFVRLLDSAQYRGDIEGGSLAIDDGAVFEGSMRRLQQPIGERLNQHLHAASAGARPTAPIPVQVRECPGDLPAE